MVNIPLVFCAACGKRGVRAINRTRTKKVLDVDVQESASLIEMGVYVIGNLCEVMTSIIEVLHVIGWKRVVIDGVDWAKFVQEKVVVLTTIAFSERREHLADANIIFHFHGLDRFLLITISDRF